jgi:uncharacterized membrane protein YcaP (DUF421 family)
MDWQWIWHSALLVLVGMVLLRIAGRKSISQMSVATTVIMISIGTTIVQPIANHHLSIAIGSASVFILTLLLIEYLEMKFQWIERLLNGHAKVIIDNGRYVHPELRKMRLTVDKLEMQLRQQGVQDVQDVQTATIEANGQLAVELKPQARPVTVRDLEALLAKHLPLPPSPDPIFQEVRDSGHAAPIDPKLQ